MDVLRINQATYFFSEAQIRDEGKERVHRDVGIVELKYNFRVYLLN